MHIMIKNMKICSSNQIDNFYKLAKSKKLMKISYGKNVYGKEEINSVVKQLQKTTMDCRYEFEKLVAKQFSKKRSYG